jgi:hypothetical protein
MIEDDKGYRLQEKRRIQHTKMRVPA